MLNGRLRTFEVGPRGAVGASPTRNRTGRKFHSFLNPRVQSALVAVAFRTVPTRSSRTHFFSTAVLRSSVLAYLAAPRPASEESHTESPTTAKRALPTLSVAPKSRSVLVMQPPTGACTSTRVSALRTSRRGQASGRARRQLDLAPREVTKASSGLSIYPGPMDLGAGISALEELPRRRPVIDRTSGRRSTFSLGVFYDAQRELLKGGDVLIIL